MSSDRVSLKLRRIADVTKKPRERFTALTDMKNEGFTEAETREIFSKGTNGVTVQQLYSEFTQASDVESETRGKQLTVTEVLGVMGILRSLLIHNAEKVASESWYLPFFEQQVLCYLHVENHIAVRRAALELLVAVIEIKFAPKFVAPVATSPTDEVASQRQDSSGSVVDRATVNLLLSAIDWDFFRATYNAPIVLPNFILEIRQTRHHFVPTRLRSITAGTDVDREKEAMAMLRLVLLDVFTTPALPGPPRVAFWYNFLYCHVLPIVLPVQGYRAGVVRIQTWDGFAHGKHRRMHQLLIDSLQHLRSDPSRFAATFGSSLDSMKLALMIITDVLRDPDASEAPSAVKACVMLTSFLRNPPAFFEAAVHEVLGSWVGEGLPDACVGFLVAASSSSSDLGVFQALVEAYCELLLVAVQSSAVRLSDATRDKATLRIGHIAGALSRAAAAKPSVHLDEVVPYTCQAFWTAISYTIPIASSRFTSLTSPIFLSVEAAIVAAGTAPGATAHPPLSYMIRCWSYLVLYACRAFAALDRSALPSFAFPLSSSSTASASGPSGGGATAVALLEFRSKRMPVPTEQCSRSICEAMRTASAVSSSGDPIHNPALGVLTEALHNLLHNLVDDSLPTRKGKCIALCEVVRILCHGSRSGALSSLPSPSLFFVEPDSLAKMVVPYLMIASHLAETPAGPQDQWPPAAGKPKLSIVAKEALECMSELLALPRSPGRPMDRTVFSLVMNRIDEVLAQGLSGAVNLEECPGRILSQLARNNTSSLASRPSGSVFVNGHQGITLYSHRLFSTALAVFSEIEPMKGSALTSFLDSKSAALNTAQWAMTFLLGHEGLDENKALENNESLISAFGNALRSTYSGDGHILIFVRTVWQAITPAQAKYPHGQLTRTCAQLFSLVLRCSQPIVLDSTSWSVLCGLADIVCVHWNTLDRSQSMLPHYSSSLLLVESLIERMSLGTPSEVSVVDLLYSRFVTTLCATIMYHVNNWLSTRYTGEALLMMLSLLSDLTTRAGRLHIFSYAPQPHHRVPLAQLVADVCNFILCANTTHRYAISHIPGSPKERRMNIMRITNAYELIQEAELDSSNSKRPHQGATSAAVFLVVPPEEASGRKWSGPAVTVSTGEGQGSTTAGDTPAAGTPNPASPLQPNLLSPSAVGHAAQEIHQSLLLLESTVPNEVSDRHEWRGLFNSTSSENTNCGQSLLDSGFKVGDFSALYLREESLDSGGRRRLLLESHTAVGNFAWLVDACVCPSHEASVSAQSTQERAQVPIVNLKEPAATLESILEDYAGPHTCPRELSGKALTFSSPLVSSTSIEHRREQSLTSFVPATFPVNKFQLAAKRDKNGFGGAAGSSVASGEQKRDDAAPIPTSPLSSSSPCTPAQTPAASVAASPLSIVKLSRATILFSFAVSIGLTGLPDPSVKVKPHSSSVHGSSFYKLMGQEQLPLLFDSVRPGPGELTDGDTNPRVRSQTQIAVLNFSCSSATNAMQRDLFSHFGVGDLSSSSSKDTAAKTSSWQAASGHDVVLFLLDRPRALTITNEQIFHVVLCDSYLAVASAWAQIKQQYNGTVATACVLLAPGPSQETVFSFCGRTSDAAPLLAPISDGTAVTMPQVALMLRAAAITSCGPFRRCLRNSSTVIAATSSLSSSQQQFLAGSGSASGQVKEQPLGARAVRDSFIRALRPSAADMATVFSL
jgi:hypothetical protein